MARNKSKGFAKVEERRTRVRGYDIFTSIWSFDGELPTINRRTKQSWDEKLSPKGDKTKI